MSVTQTPSRNDILVFEGSRVDHARSLRPSKCEASPFPSLPILLLLLSPVPLSFQIPFPQRNDTHQVNTAFLPCFPSYPPSLPNCNFSMTNQSHSPHTTSHITLWVPSCPLVLPFSCLPLQLHHESLYRRLQRLEHFITEAQWRVTILEGFNNGPEGGIGPTDRPLFMSHMLASPASLVHLGVRHSFFPLAKDVTAFFKMSK